MSDDEKQKTRRGFAAMPPEKQRAIASRGGRIAHETGRAHEFTVAEARVAGKKGGTLLSQDREYMSRIGKLGGKARARNMRKAKGAEVETAGTCTQSTTTERE